MFVLIFGLIFDPFITCLEGWYTSPKTTPSRVVFCTGLLFSLVCYAAYTATIVSELWDTVVPIRSLEALMTNSKYIYVESQSDIAEIVVEVRFTN